MKKLSIEYGHYKMMFGRDTDFHDPYAVTTYLDTHTGDLLWVYEADSGAMMSGIDESENKKLRQRVAKSPTRYLKIVGLCHGDHHDILKDFIGSKWSDDEGELLAARSAYFGSIGGWLKTLDNYRAKELYFRFKDQRVEELGEKYLRDRGIDPVWV